MPCRMYTEQSIFGILYSVIRSFLYKDHHSGIWALSSIKLIIICHTFFLASFPRGRIICNRIFYFVFFYTYEREEGVTLSKKRPSIKRKGGKIFFYSFFVPMKVHFTWSSFRSLPVSSIEELCSCTLILESSSVPYKWRILYVFRKSNAWPEHKPLGIMKLRAKTLNLIQNLRDIYEETKRIDCEVLCYLYSGKCL